MLSLALGACSKKEAAVPGGVAGKSAKAEKDWRIAVVPKDSTNAWFVRMELGVKRYAADTGLNAFQKGPAKTDAAEQVKVIEDLIAQSVDAICVVPVDPAALEPVLKKAMDKGIVVVSHEGSSLENTYYDIEAFDNSAYGAFIMDSLAAAMGESGLYTTMVAHVTNASHNEWADGAVARQKAAYPALTLLSGQDRVESEDNMEKAYEVAKQLFKAQPTLKGIVGTSSKDAPGIARAIAELGLTGKAFTAGTGMPNECRDALKNGSLAAITLWDPADSGYALCALAVKILRGEPVAAPLDLGLDGYRDMQIAGGAGKVFLGSGWIGITAANVDEYNF
ncbi:MAG: autoinducer 2 ABC transporter substrate-binding protein [Spirochaetaceae bacterium]|jgi:simple sugar transport system substrate-binding protein|nr:autoinducer 2 ABC transporter substrate-binding protein [Spirochaetaceae bacterium]